MSLLSYNGIQLNLLKTNSVERTVRLSEDNTEYVHTEWTISVTAVYSPAAGATTYFQGNPPVYERGHLPSETDSVIRHWLMQPRRPLLYQEGGIDILQIPGNLVGGGAIDAFNGPLPQSCSISRIAGARLFYVNYVVKCFVIECPPASQCEFFDECCALVSSRYSRTEYIDDQYRSTLVISGIAYFRSDALAFFSRSADFYRGFLIPPYLRGYKRKNIQFTLAHNGTAIEYNCMDVEQFQDLGELGVPGTAASVGITDMDLRYSCGPAMGGGAGKVQIVGYGALVNVFAAAKGMKAANTLYMTFFLLAVCVQKLGIIFKKENGQKGIGVPTGARITEDVFRKEVTVSLDYFVNYDKDNQVLEKAAVPIDGWIGQNLAGQPRIVNLPDLGGLNPQPPFSQGTRGTAAYELAVRAFAEACYCSLDNTDPTGTEPLGDLYIPGQSYGNIPSVQGLLPPPDLEQTPNYRSSGSKNFRSLNDEGVPSYPKYNGMNKYTTYPGLITLPPTGPVPGQSSGSSQPPPSPNDVAWYHGPPPVNIRLFMPYTELVSSIDGTRTGCALEFPDPAPVEEIDSEYTLTGRETSLSALQLDASGGGLIYDGTMIAKYTKTKSVPNQADLPYPVPPSMALPDDSENNPGQTVPGDFIAGISLRPVVDNTQTG